MNITTLYYVQMLEQDICLAEALRSRHPNLGPSVRCPVAIAVKRELGVGFYEDNAVVASAGSVLIARRGQGAYLFHTDRETNQFIHKYDAACGFERPQEIPPPINIILTLVGKVPGGA